MDFLLWITGLGSFLNITPVFGPQSAQKDMIATIACLALFIPPDPIPTAFLNFQGCYRHPCITCWNASKLALVFGWLLTQG